MAPDPDGYPTPLEVDLTFRDSGARLVPALAPDPEIPPYLGISRGPRNVGTLSVTINTVTNGVPQRIYVDRPTLLLPRFDLLAAAPGQFTFWDIVFSPTDTPLKAFLNPAGTQNVGIRLPGGAIYLWAKGTWYIYVFSTTAGNLLFTTIASEDTTILERLLNQSADNGSSERALAAATVTDIVDGPQMAGMLHLRISNSGANPATFVFGDNEVPDANTGFLLNSGAFMTFTGQEIPMGRLRAFSTLGTNLHIITVDRFSG